jgi:Zn-dependent M16 (insulinase) family peptidase
MSKSKSLLWLVACAETDQDGDPAVYDLFVIADSAEQAVELWRKHHIEVNIADEKHTAELLKLAAEDLAEGIKAIEDVWAKRKVDAAYRIPEEELLCRAPRVIPWGKMDIVNF